MRAAGLDIELVGDALPVPCLDGVERPYVNLDAAASTSALPAVAERVAEFLPWYSSVHRGAGYKSQLATAAYEDAREAIRCFARRSDRDDVAIICRNTTEAINHLAYRLPLRPTDVVLTTVVEHHANLLPWGRVATRRFVECEADGTFELAAVREALDAEPRPRLLAVTGASNVTGWVPPIESIIASAHERGVPVLVDAAQLAPHRPLPVDADFLAFSGHKMYAPYGAGALIGPRSAFADGDPFLAGGGAVDLVELDEVVWSPPPEREEAGSPNVLGAVASGAAARELAAIGWQAIRDHDAALARALRAGLSPIPGVRLLGPGPDADTLPIASFVVDGVAHPLVAARLSAEFGIGVRHGCFCAHPYLVRLLGLGHYELRRFRSAARRHDRSSLPGAVRASA
ncbi:MAG TPA: aminotransferase class V-fold PLP-dependent enzyme, partial [Solirubrobacteraceae bacterium]